MTLISKIVKETRLSKRLSQRDFAKALDVSHMTVNLWESGAGTPSEETLKQFRSSDIIWKREFGLRLLSAQLHASIDSVLPETKPCEEAEA